MEQALGRLNDFDVFVIDEADDWIIEHEIHVDQVNERIFGFWDLKQKRTILLSATVSFDM